MKNKLILLVLLLIMSLSMTGCGNNKTKTLKCTATESQEERTTTSNLEIKIKNDEVKDMTLVLNIDLPESNQAYQQAVIGQLRQKTDQIYVTNNRIKAVFGMDSYFSALGISKDASYSELKQVLEIQGYTCKE